MKLVRYILLPMIMGLILLSDVSFAVEGSKETWQKAKEGIEYRGPAGESPNEIQKDEAERTDAEDRSPRQKTEPREQKDREPVEPREPGRSPFMTVVGYAAIGLIVLFLIILIIRAIDPTLRNRKTTAGISKSITSVEENPEELSETELQRLLRLALESRDFRTAVRVTFLMVLENLDRNSIVKWHKHKTNRQYLVEASSKISRGDFQVLILAYEQVWFGDLIPDQAYFDAYDSMSQTLKTGRNEK